MRVAGCCRIFPPKGLRGLLGPNQNFSQWAQARVHPGWVASSSQDPYWWQWLPPQGANCTSEATLGFSILLKDTSTCSSVPPWGAGIRISDLLITSQPALPTELQPPHHHKQFGGKSGSHIQHTNVWCENLNPLGTHTENGLHGEEGDSLSPAVKLMKWQIFTFSCTMEYSITEKEELPFKHV